MKIPLVPIESLEHAAWVLRFNGMRSECHSHLVFEDERVAERRWLHRRFEARDEPDRRINDRRDSEVERAVFDFLREFCTPELGAALDAKFAPCPDTIPIVRESARFLKAA